MSRVSCIALAITDSAEMTPNGEGARLSDGRYWVDGFEPGWRPKLGASWLVRTRTKLIPLDGQ
eukprot:scaffold85616_cov43-Prasinocladus_malaysianus.AAC.1